MVELQRAGTYRNAELEMVLGRSLPCQRSTRNCCSWIATKHFISRNLYASHGPVWDTDCRGPMPVVESPLFLARLRTQDRLHAVFHNCGKICGKSRLSTHPSIENRCWIVVRDRRKLKTAGFHWAGQDTTPSNRCDTAVTPGEGVRNPDTARLLRETAGRAGCEERRR
jgi:hypothetical protein